jgi:hypothetical protein
MRITDEDILILRLKPGWIALLHQLEDAGHAGTLKLRQYRAALKL